jgi:hypothetical protein
MEWHNSVGDLQWYITFGTYPWPALSALVLVTYSHSHSFNDKSFNSRLFHQVSGVIYQVKVTAVVKPTAPDWASVSLFEDGRLFYSRKVLFLPLFFLSDDNIQSEDDSKGLMNCIYIYIYIYMFHVLCINQMYKNILKGQQFTWVCECNCYYTVIIDTFRPLMSFL